MDSVQYDRVAGLLWSEGEEIVLAQDTTLVPGGIYILVQGKACAPTSGAISPGSLFQRLHAGALIGPRQGEPLFRVVGLACLPLQAGWTGRAWCLESLTGGKFSKGRVGCSTWKKGFSLARVTLSDKGAAGQREDLSGPVIEELMATALQVGLMQRFLLPDDLDALRALLVSLCLEQKVDLVVTTGGTGLTPRDIAPEATLKVIDRRLPGIEQAMHAASLRKTPHGALSRAVAGTLGQSLIINLPGSPKAVRENLTPLLPALEHALKKLKGDPSDCAEIHS